MINRLKHIAYGCKKKKPKRLVCVACGFSALKMDILKRFCQCADPLIIEMKIRKKPYLKHPYDIMLLYLFLIMLYILVAPLISIYINF